MAAKVREDIRSMSGIERAAALLLALGEEHSARVFALLADEEIKELTAAMASLGAVSPHVLDKICIEFAEQISSTGALIGTFDTTERMLSKAMPSDRVAQIMDEIRGPAGRTMWDKLGNVNEGVLANYLKNEYPQTVAVVLTKVRPDHAARVLTQLPEAFAMEVVMRMLRMETVQKEILEDVEKTLRTEFMSNLARTSRVDPHDVMSEIFNNFDRNTESRFMSALEERNKDSAEKIRSLMFTFDDLGRLDPGGVQTLLRGVDKTKLAVALKGSTESMRELFFANMSERASKLLKEDMASMGPVRLKDVDESQMYMVTIAKELANKGEILLADKKGGDDELIY
jgi:flagellar motor switch protein FliG